MNNTMNKNLFITISIISAFLLTSCATVINTTTQSVSIKSEPPNARLTIDGKKFGITPQVVNLERGSDHLIRLELDGYDIYETQVTRKISAWYWSNILNGFIFGGLLDYINGSMYNLLPERMDIELQVAKPAPPPPSKR
jgi:hypothetical protein